MRTYYILSRNYYLMICDYISESIWAYNFKRQMLLLAPGDNEPNLDEHILSVCQKAR